MDNINNIACPVCTLYLRPGITLENHLTSHPKQKVIEALIRATQVCPQNVDKTVNNECQTTSEMTMLSPMNSNMNQIPSNHSFIYQQFMSSSGTQPILNMNPINQQFVAVPTVFNPQMVCSPYIFQQQQQVQILSAAANFPPILQRPATIMLPPSSPAICSSAESEVTDPLSTKNSSSKCSEKSFKGESVREKLTISNFDDSEELKDEDQQNKDYSSEVTIETNENDKIFSVAITDVDNEKQEDKDKIDDDLSKACQTTQTVEKETPNNISELDPTNNVGQIVLIASEHEILNESDNVFEREQNLECVPSGSGLQENVSVTVLEMDDINFILPNDYIPNEPSLTKVNEIECINESSRDGNVLMNIGEGTVTTANILINISEEKCIIGTPHFEDEEKIDEEGLSRESLNIRADERMPPRGELSEQESNEASEIGWESKIYQEGSSGMSNSYDLEARESWEASDCSDSEMPPLQSRIQPLDVYNQEDADESESKSVQLETSLTSSLDFSCSTCGETFRCPKERRVHQANEHAASSSSAAKKTFKKRVVRLTKAKTDNKLEALVKDEPKLEPQDLAENGNEEKFDIKENILCNTCGELLSSIKELNIHNKKVHNIRIPNQNLICKTCKEAFSNQTQFTEHLKEHPLECNICAKHFYKLPNLRLHLKRHSGIRPHKCDICSKSFFAKQKLREHLNIHTGQSPIRCTMCNETFRRYSNLIQHRNIHHLNIKKKIRDFVCHCGEIYHSKNKLNWHKETHEPKPKSCKYCHEKFIHMASLTRHIRRAHNQRYVPEVKRENENVECEICNGVYLKSSLDAHLHTHSGKKQHSCPICSKEFSTKWNLKLHKWTHAAPTSKPYKCEICQSAFIRQSDYVSHMNSHKSIRPYTCNYCGCKFIRKYNCLRHVKEHEEGKSYMCTICNKSFHRSYYLKEHMRVHSGVRPFSCNICGKTSTTKSNHNKHMKIHHAREPVMTEG